MEGVLVKNGFCAVDVVRYAAAGVSDFTCVSIGEFRGRRFRGDGGPYGVGEEKYNSDSSNPCFDVDVGFGRSGGAARVS